MTVDIDPSLRNGGARLDIFGAPVSLEAAIRAYQTPIGMYEAAVEFLDGVENGRYDNPSAVVRYAEDLANMADFIERVGINKLL